MRWLIPLLTLLLVAGCSPSGEGDSGGTRDAGGSDVAAADAAASADVGRSESPTDSASPPPDTSAAPNASDAAMTDAVSPDAAPGPRPVYTDCFPSLLGQYAPDYDQFEPTIGRHCQGTDHQDIVGVERVVFLGDSVTAGTPPTRAPDFYRRRLGDAFESRFPGVEIANCSAFGARTDDLLIGQGQIPECFPEGGDTRTTLVIFTIGGNDILNWAQDALDVEAGRVEADAAAQLLDDAMAWFREPDRFPNGVHVIYANPFEFTDATGDLEACQFADLVGVSGNWISGAPVVIHFLERFMEIAVRHQVDMVFSMESFCGHGLHHDNPESQCYLGPDAEPWFDLTCIHPNTVGHAALTELFLSVVDE